MQTAVDCNRCKHFCKYFKFHCLINISTRVTHVCDHICKFTMKWNWDQIHFWEQKEVAGGSLTCLGRPQSANTNPHRHDAASAQRLKTHRTRVLWPLCKKPKVHIKRKSYPSEFISTAAHSCTKTALTAIKQTAKRIQIKQRSPIKHFIYFSHLKLLTSQTVDWKYVGKTGSSPESHIPTFFCQF